MHAFENKLIIGPDQITSYVVKIAFIRFEPLQHILNQRPISDRCNLTRVTPILKKGEYIV